MSSTSSSTLCSIFGISSAERVNAHYQGAKAHLTNSNELLRKSSHEQNLFAKYFAEGEPAGPTIYSSKGEHFTEVCPSLKQFIDEEMKLDWKYFGYMEFAYGIEEHRTILKKLLIRDHQLEEDLIQPDIFEVACLMNSTRLAMFDLGRLIQIDCGEQQPVVLSFEPGWDYTGVYQSLKMKVLHLPITPKTEFEPNLNEWKKYLKEQNVEKIDLVIINTQHNPTGKQWSIDIVNYLMDLAYQHESYVLIDDAYYCVHDPTIEIVNTLKIWLKRLHKTGNKKMFTRWLHTRPFGKQYNCNAMGIAAISASPDLISRLNEIYWDHNYLNGCVNAEIICQWLNKHQDDADQFIIDNCFELVRKKNFIRHFLQEKLGYPATSICTGPSTSYLLFEVPLVYQKDSTNKPSEISEQFSDELYFATGVMLSGKLFSHSDVSSFVRLHLGSDMANLEEIMRRFQNAGLNFEMKTKFHQSMGIGQKFWNFFSS